MFPKSYQDDDSYFSVVGGSLNDGNCGGGAVLGGNCFPS
jgi:hypothetical protein